ncbi:NADPH-dependent FMN reductase [compost metagenome]
MSKPLQILAIIGSAQSNSSNESIVTALAAMLHPHKLTIFPDLKSLPHFDPEQSVQHPPAEVLQLRAQIGQADGIIICSPEYIFSIPSGLKNVFEWCVATTVFSDKPTGIITASASGQKAHEELQLILKTLMAQFTAHTTLLIPGVKGKVNEAGDITDTATKDALQTFSRQFLHLLP